MAAGGVTKPECPDEHLWAEQAPFVLASNPPIYVEVWRCVNCGKTQEYRIPRPNVDPILWRGKEPPSPIRDGF
jgi:hypothetical protein